MLDAPLQIAAIFVLGALAQWTAWKSRLPSILLLLLTGLIAGPLLGLIRPDEIFGDALLPIVSLAVGFILFDGGLELSLREIRETGRVVWRLVTVGMIVTWAVALVAARVLFDLPMGLVALLAAIVVVSGPTVVGPLLRHIRPTGPVGPVLKWEGIVIDPIGVLLTLLVFEVVLLGDLDQAPLLILQTAAITITAGTLIGLTAAWALVTAIRRFWVPDFLQNSVTLMLVVAAFAGANAVAHEAGLFATTVMGIAMANQRKADIHAIQDFAENLRTLMLSVLFVVLAARLNPGDIRAIGWQAVGFLAVLVVVARPLSVLVSAWGSKLTHKERLFLMFMMPRGIVAAAVSSVFAIRLQQRGIAQASALVPTVFLVIIGTVVIYGLAAPLAARRLKLAEANPRGVVFAGAQQWARMLAEALQSIGVRVLLVDTSHPHITACRFMRLPSHEGSILSEQTLDELDLSGMGRIFACTPNPWVNTLAAKRFERYFGRAEVYRVRCTDAEIKALGDSEPGERQTRWLFSATITEQDLESRVERGDVIRPVTITDAPGFAALLERIGADAVPLVIVARDGRVIPVTADRTREPQVGETVIALTRPPADLK